MKLVFVWLIPVSFVGVLFFVSPSQVIISPAKQPVIAAFPHNLEPISLAQTFEAEIELPQAVKKRVQTDDTQRFLTFSLTGIFVNTDSPKQSFAIIEWPKSQSVNARIGDLLEKEVFVDDITANYVVLKYKNTLHQLRLDITPRSIAYTPDDNRLRPNNVTHTPGRPINLTSSTSNSRLNRINQPQDVQLVKQSNRGDFKSETEIKNTKHLDTEEINVVGAWQRHNVEENSAIILTSDNSTTIDDKAGDTPSGQSRDDDETFTSTLPEFMSANETDTYVPSFMQGGELDVYLEQIPDYMRQ